MKNKYVDFISDKHFLDCVANLHAAYLKAKKNVSKKSFYSNKVDTIKLTFDSKFNNIDEESLIQAEILRQLDKSINNSIGTFHEEILGGIIGFEKGNKSGYDIKATDNTLFADIKNKHNTISAGAQLELFNSLAAFADKYKSAKCYWVQILAKKSFNMNWAGEIKGTHKSHPRVYKISGDQFYYLLSGQKDALFQLYKSLPLVVDDYLNSLPKSLGTKKNFALDEIKSETTTSKRTILNQITFENYCYYLGFDKL